MPGIQNLGQPGLQPLERQHLETGPLGQVGNLRFQAGPGATPRAPAPNVLQRFGNFMSKLAFYVTASPAQRAQQFVLDQARDNSRRIGNLLGNLTGSPDNPKVLSKIAQGLARLSDLSGGLLSRLPGGAESLKTYLRELGLSDLTALRNGVLGNSQARQAVLALIEPPRLREGAGRVLDEISTGLGQELAGQALQAPLEQVRTELGRKPVDGQALQTALGRLSESLAMLGGDMLETHLQTLSDAELKALQQVLRPSRLDGPKAALDSTRDPDAQPLSRKDAPDRIHETYDPDIIQSGRIEQGKDLLDRLGGALDRTIQARIEQSHPDLGARLQTAITEGNPKAIIDALFDLNQQVYDLQGVYGDLPARTTGALRAQMVLAMDALRDVETNPEGPLSRDSLAKLDDATFGLLRRCSELRAFGLRLDSAGARAEGLARVQNLTNQVVQGMTGLLQTLSGDPVDMPVLMRQMRDLAELELQRTQQLGELGHYGHVADVDGRKTMVGDALRAALAGLRESGQDEVAQRALGQLNLLLTLEGTFGGAAFGLNDAIAEEGPAHGASEVAKRLSTTQHVLDGITSVIHGMLTESNGGVEPVVEEIDLPEGFLSSLQEQYGVRYDPDAFQSTLVVTDDMVSRLVPHLEAPIDPGVHPTRPVSLPVGDTEQTFPVSVSFFKDAIERRGVSLSVRGTDPEGGMVRTTWPGDVPDEGRDVPMGEALDALFKIAGPAAEPLTRLMNQQLGGAILTGLRDMGQDSPFKLDDGTVVMPIGAGRFHFDVDKRPDGSFRIVGKMTIPIQDAVGLDQDGNAIPVTMDPAHSWAQVQVTLDVSPDGQQFRMTEPPQFRHHFVPVA